MPKLTGDEYRDYWRTRIAKGQGQVGFFDMDTAMAEAQADQIFDLIQKYTSWFSWFNEPHVAVELGCGYGRMMKRFAKLWPEAVIHGVDLCPEAIDWCKTNLDPVQFCFDVGERIPEEMSGIVDVAYTVTCLQHITDETIFETAVRSLWDAVRPGGALLMFENVVCTKARHVRGHPWQGYVRPLGEDEQVQPVWADRLMLRNEPHDLILVRKAFL